MAILAVVAISAAAQSQIYVAPSVPADASAFQTVPAPGIRFRANEATATQSPWIDSNAWRFQRGLQKANYEKLPTGSAPLAAAEAFTFGVAAILNPDPADQSELEKMMAFLKAQDAPRMAELANIGVIDDRSPAMDEVLNMLTRRNLLYRVVSAPERGLDLTVRLGTPDFPRESARDPSDFAARVREKLGDEKRLVRLYGSGTTIAHLTGDGKHARLYLLSYGRGRNQTQQDLRIRLLGNYRPAMLAAYGAAPNAELADVENLGNAVEFTLPPFRVIAVIDLEANTPAR
jgi:hypothetical protein